MLTIEQQFSAWLAGELSLTELEQQLENLTQEQQASWYKRIEQSQALMQLAQTTEPQVVPSWQPEHIMQAQMALNKPSSSTWLQRLAPTFSLAFSSAALVLVLFNAQLTIEQGRISLSFGEQAFKNELAQQIDQQVQQRWQQQQQQFTTGMDQLLQQQKQNDLALSQYVLSASRKERKQDFQQLVQYINAQRADDVLLQDLKYQQLANNVLLQSQQP